jgi:hypothetical protein
MLLESLIWDNFLSQKTRKVEHCDKFILQRSSKGLSAKRLQRSSKGLSSRRLQRSSKGLSEKRLQRSSKGLSAKRLQRAFKAILKGPKIIKYVYIL